MSAVSITNVSKQFGKTTILNDISIDIDSGEFVILVGPSGCGKSTLLRMLAGLEDVSSGEISIDDKIVNELAPKDRGIAMVFQSYALYPQMTVEQNIGFPLEMLKVPKKEIEVKVLEAARILGLEALLHRKPSQLSGGQRQRVAMGRAMVRDPKVFLFDEPLSNLDAKLRVKMRAEIKGLHERLKNTIVYVTHDQIEAMTMADKIVVLNEGNVEQVGSPLSLYDNPANIFVAGFLGSPSMNFINVRSSGEKMLFGQSSYIDKPMILNSKEHHEELTLGIRPDNFILDENGTIQAKIKVIEPTGNETFLNAEIDGVEATIVVKDRVTAKPGEMLKFRVGNEKIHFFNRETGSSIT